MFSILKKEFHSFFASPVGYLVIGLFLILNGLFLWVFDSGFNIFDYGFADLTPFFQLTPWIFIFLIPAVTMRSFSDELRLGTLELLLARPISPLQLILGKFLGALTLIVLALIPTLVYVYAIDQLGNPPGNFDSGILIGSYLGLLFLAAAYTAIGIFASMLSENQIVAFLIAVFLCFLFYFGFDALSAFLNTELLNSLSLSRHFESISRGVLDSRDLVYFLAITAIFIALTRLKLESKSL
ncbi:MULTISPECIES: gliding motility-associated ABC transporter permease subunit GldF [unclassified Leeuwenhoekiella]|uniref:gliding motility-associated ABC transporter permease subunit GldF n=1 Tax=unclassified Leeuwenhoekiella TaxID=2615029 RepID=UPI000C5AEB29|nr:MULTISPECIES: gliding motility-associated ABC transporter permease subunit GldF [unclassified Leeuwenhoekiella]MAW93844.1 gliding motility-associated ABC transporter permease subunit GldF [Leeuwenhoekiella sp.]MBA82251.1 gliding motility-associated ABC transporter permease subunit GldF [Leeuwenhoekiella sp.]|tara:strand:- start:994 stop:1713 length:720 start_codon:yes stop_codon:yes gene_type:complete